MLVLTALLWQSGSQIWGWSRDPGRRGGVLAQGPVQSLEDQARDRGLSIECYRTQSTQKGPGQCQGEENAGGMGPGLVRWVRELDGVSVGQVGVW